jgi:hypothetical protein
MQKKSLFAFVAVALVAVALVLVGGVFLVWNQKTQQPPNKSTQASENLVKKEFRTTVLSEERDHVLSRAKITAVTYKEDSYKQVTVSNPATRFSFEVPDTWLSETRNSGEVEMNEEELREFFATNYFRDLRDNPDTFTGKLLGFLLGTCSRTCLSMR